MSGKQNKRARRQARQEAAGWNPAAFIPALPETTIRERMEAFLASNPETPEDIWDAVSPWLWFEAEPKQAVDYKALGIEPPLGIYVCKDYQVSVFDEPRLGMWHLSIKRRDREPLDHDRWRILQTVKNTLVGSENEAVELYPAESRLVDTANQYHLWAIKSPQGRFPFGFQTRLVTATSGHGAVQRPFSPDLPTTATPEDEAHYTDVAAGRIEPSKG